MIVNNDFDKNSLLLKFHPGISSLEKEITDLIRSRIEIQPECGPIKLLGFISFIKEEEKFNKRYDEQLITTMEFSTIINEVSSNPGKCSDVNDNDATKSKNSVIIKEHISENGLDTFDQMTMTDEVLDELSDDKITYSSEINGNNASISYQFGGQDIVKSREISLVKDSVDISKTNIRSKSSRGYRPLKRNTALCLHTTDFSKRQKRHMCSFCNKSYEKPHLLATHIRTHTGEKPFSCAICCRSFKSMCYVKLHMRNHLENKPYICNICNRGFNIPAQLRIHKRSHTGEKPFLCVICGKSFVRKTHLESHSRIHSGEKNFICKTCGGSFARKESLLSHAKIHMKPYSCETCDKAFSSSSRLKRHIQSLHNSHLCLSCDRTFSTVYTLEHHLNRYHNDTTETAFRCVACDKEFSLESYLRKHVNRVHVKDSEKHLIR